MWDSLFCSWAFKAKPEPRIPGKCYLCVINSIKYFVLLTVLNTGRRPRCHNLLEEGRKWFPASPTCRLPACLVCVIDNVMVMMPSPCWQWWQWLVMRSYWKKIKTMLDNVKKTLPCGGWHVTVPHTVECYQGPPNNNLVSWGLLYIYNFHRKDDCNCNCFTWISLIRVQILTKNMTQWQ